MKKKMIKLLEIYAKEEINLFKKTDKERALIHEYEWDNEILDTSILFEVELLSMEISGFASSILEADFTRCKQTISSLTEKSIYDNKIILDWLIKENTILIYHNYYMYILFLENYRSLVIKACQIHDK